MKRIHILVEGETEEGFVTDLLRPHLDQFSVYVSDPVLLSGVSKYSRIRGDVEKLLRDSSVVCVTTMLDFYGLPYDFPGKQSLRAGTPYQRVDYLENAFAQDIGDPRFLPFLVLHEFESLLFADVQQLVSAVPGASHDQTRRLLRVLSRFGAPELIDEGESTHPSKQIKQVIPNFDKNVHGIRAIRNMGLAKVRACCPHFDAWLQQLEQVGADP